MIFFIIDKLSFLYILVILFRSVESKYQSYISCNNFGNCTRISSLSNFKLLPNWKPKYTYKKEFFKSIRFNTTNNSIKSKSPLTNSYLNEPIKGSLKGFMCADGINECHSSCCKNGYCTDPSNSCLKIKNTAITFIYITSIVYILAIIMYWVSYIIIGIIYMKKKNKIKTSIKVQNDFSEMNSNLQLKNNENLNILKDNIEYTNKTECIIQNKDKKGLFDMKLEEMHDPNKTINTRMNIMNKFKVSHIIKNALNENSAQNHSKSFHSIKMNESIENK